MMLSNVNAPRTGIIPKGAIKPQLANTFKTLPLSRKRQPTFLRSRDDRGCSFSSGFITGGLIFGTLGFLFAPQISRVLLTEDQKLRLPKFLEEPIAAVETSKEELNDKIAQLNSIIDDVSNRLKTDQPSLSDTSTDVVSEST